jgi:hypothetical protein
VDRGVRRRDLVSSLHKSPLRFIHGHVNALLDAKTVASRSLILSMKRTMTMFCSLTLARDSVVSARDKSAVAGKKGTQAVKIHLQAGRRSSRRSSPERETD